MTLLVTVAGAGTPWRQAIKSAPPSPRRPEDVPLGSPLPRRVYAHAIVPDGVYSTDDVRTAIARDRVVATHYRDIDTDSLRVTMLTAGRAAYVSY